MPRVKFDPREVDQNFQIEDGIRNTLRRNPTAVVPVSVIEIAYDLLDDDCHIVDGTLEEKAEAIAKIVDAECSLIGSNVVFKKSNRS